ncbi:MAG: VanZ family protein [Proteobacteria bacterium]|nr:VanZ family protein [Pseudomonadota bacterium]
MLKALFIWAPPLIYVPIIFILSIRPMPESIPGNMDKVIHLLVYSIVGVIFTRALMRGIKIKNSTTTIALALLFSIALGTLIEIVQYFIPYRSASLGDIAANSAGALIGVYLYTFIAKSNKGQSHASS